MKTPKYKSGAVLAYTRNADGKIITGTVTSIYGRPPHHRGFVHKFWESSAFDGSDFAYRLAGGSTKSTGHPVTIAEYRCVPAYQCYACGEWHAEWAALKNTPEPDNCITVYEAHEEDCRAIVICARCFGRGGAENRFDMWTNQAEWDGFKPKVPHAKLPPLLDHDDEDCWSPAKYPSADTLLAEGDTP